MTTPAAPSPRPASVIHDLGYRGYDGPRLGSAAIARALYVTGLRHAYGLGRTGRSKVLPFALLGFSLVPAAVMVGVVAMIGAELPVGYAAYPNDVAQLFISIYAAAQAPVLFSRDLQHGSIVLYLARPLSSAMYASVRLASLTTAIAIFTLAPVLVLYIGSLLARKDVAEQSAAFGQAALAILLLSAMIAAITGVISSLSTRRGLAVVASIAVLVVGAGFVAAVQALALDRGSDLVAQLAALASPYTIYTSIAHLLDDSVVVAIAPSGVLGGLVFIAVALAIPALGLLLLMRRFATVASR